jgi:hypothetical protein
VKKTEAVFCVGFFQAAVEIIKEKVAEGYLYRFPGLRQFPRASPSEWFFLFASFSFL